MIASSLITHITTFILIYSIGIGMGAGLAYMPPIITAWEYFPNHKGVISGVIITGYGLSAFVFGFIWLEIVNPDNLSPTVSIPGGMIFDENT